MKITKTTDGYSWTDPNGADWRIQKLDPRFWALYSPIGDFVTHVETLGAMKNLISGGHFFRSYAKAQQLGSADAV